MIKKVEISTLILLFILVFYCALTIGTGWDELSEILRGNQRLKYLFSLGSWENYWKEQNDEFYPGFYTTLASFFTKMFPKKYEFEIWHLINSLVSIFTIFGIYRISRNLFNKKVGKIIFLLCFFNPTFFGHMAINPKDTIVAFANVWTTYFFLKYLQNQNPKINLNYYVILAGLTIGLGTGVRIPFVITLAPLFIFAIVDMLFFKKITNQNFCLKKFTFDLILVLIIAYLITVSFWPHAHVNIFTEPFKLLLLFIERSSDGANVVALPWMLFNGNFVETNPPPNSYLIISFFHKLPEFILFSYVIFIYLIFTNKKFFLIQFNFFWTKVFLILFIFLFPIVSFIISPYIAYDGLRLVIYLIPYFCIIPGLAIYYLIYNFKSLVSKILILTIGSLIIYYLYIFALLTPYQYIYLNRFNGKFANAYNKYENDYWGTSFKELIKKIPTETNLISNNKKNKIIFCGYTPFLGKKELEKLENLKFELKSIYEKNDYDYVIMTNRIIVERNKNILPKVKTCFEKFDGTDLIKVERNGLMLSTLRKNLN